MREVTGPIVATALVLCAVFVPTAFISGLTGQFYKQFALTIAISTVISAFNSLTLSPALSALLLKAHGAPPDRLTRISQSGCSAGFFRPFNRFFARASHGYVQRRGPRAARRRHRAFRLWRPHCAHLSRFRPHADRLRAARRTSSTWSRLRSCRRCRDARSHRGGDSAHGRDRPQAAGRGKCGGIPGLDHQRLHQQSQLGHRLRDPQALRGAPDPSAVRRRHRRGAQSASTARSRTPSSRCFRRRRCRDWAPSAAFACRSRIAAAWASRSSTRQTAESDRQGQPDAGSSQGSSPATR